MALKEVPAVPADWKNNGIDSKLGAHKIAAVGNEKQKRYVTKAFLQWLYIAFSHHNSYHLLEFGLVKCQAPVRARSAHAESGGSLANCDRI